MKKLIAFALVQLLCAGLASSAPAAPLDACDLVTRSEAQEAAGVRLAEGNLTEFEGKVMEGTTLCHFESSDPDHYKRFVSIELKIAKGVEEAAEQLEGKKLLMQSPETAGGIGDEAVWGGGVLKPAGGLNVRVGKYLLEVKVNREESAANLRESKALAQKALSRLR